MKNFSEIKYQLDVGDPISREVFLRSLSNLKEAFIKKGPWFAKFEFHQEDLLFLYDEFL